MLEDGCLIVNWHSAVFRDLVPNVATRSFCLLKIGSTVKVFSFERMRIRFQRFLRSFNKRVPSPGTSEPLLHSMGYPGKFPTFFHLFDILNTVENKIFLFCARLLIFWHGSFSKVFLTASWLIAWGLSDRGKSFRDSQALQALFHPMNSHSSDVQLHWNLSFLEARA